MGKIVINNVELELNLMDADVVEKFENLNTEIVKKIRDPKAYEGKSTADGMRYQCRCVEEFFDKLFGYGTADKVFPKNNDLEVRMDAFGRVCAESGNAKQKVTELTNKYNPARAANREQRRAQMKNGKNNGRHNYQ